MEFDLSKTQKMLQESARTFFQHECPLTKVRELMETSDAKDDSLWNGIAVQGWTGLALPEEHDGLGLGLVDLAAIGEEMGRACLPAPFMASVWAATLIAESGNAGLKSRYLPSLALGKLKATIGLLEEESSWDPSTVQMNVASSGEGVSLSGSKHLVLDAEVADVILVVARHDGDLTVVAVDKEASGVSFTASPGLDMTRKFYRIDLDNVQVTKSQIVASGKTAHTALTRSLQTGATLSCAEMIGGMQWVLETSLEYSKTRQQFDKPIGSFQAVQHQCADMLLLLESARVATYYAAWTLTENDPNGARALSMAKAYCSDAAREVGNSGIQIHGGIGFTWEHDLHLFYRRAKANEFLFGDATYHREQLAKLILN